MYALRWAIYLKLSNSEQIMIFRAWRVPLKPDESNHLHGYAKFMKPSVYYKI